MMQLNDHAKSIITYVVYQKMMGINKAIDALEALQQQFEITSKDQLFKMYTKFLPSTWQQVRMSSFA